MKERNWLLSLQGSFLLTSSGWFFFFLVKKLRKRRNCVSQKRPSACEQVLRALVGVWRRIQRNLFFPFGSHTTSGPRNAYGTHPVSSGALRNTQKQTSGALSCPSYLCPATATQPLKRCPRMRGSNRFPNTKRRHLGKREGRVELGCRMCDELVGIWQKWSKFPKFSSP